ncbi:MAG TPA: penicillin-binding protein 1C, partial [Candidatus Methylomirabilis sp.]|nr:penicillin-binding protein 1C [Candidatus Methylomirabilis sp.]
MRLRLYAGAGVAGLALMTLALWLGFGTPIPPPPTFDRVRASWKVSEMYLLDRTGEVIHEQRVDDRRRRLPWVALADISPALQAAVLASEDRRFPAHSGVDVRAVVAATAQRLTGHGGRGASTITMQLASFLDPALRRRGGPRSLPQKVRQMRIAWALEERWRKAEILEAYLNLVTFSGELQGVGAAAHVLFGKAPHGLTEPEALVLAALLRAPNAGPAAVVKRAERLASGGTVPRDAIESAAARVLATPVSSGPRVALAPHAAARLLRASSSSGPPTPRVVTTLDGALQTFALETLSRQLLAVHDQRVNDGAVLVVDNASGEVLAYVGGSGALSGARHVDAIQARRQAGSALKPFLYGLAFEQRLLTPASLLEDSPLEVATPTGLYRPHNYDEQFRGLVSVRTALGASLNVPAVRALGLVGADAMVQQLRDLGFAGLVEAGDFYGPSLALGSADVTLWEMVGAYRALATGGIWSPLRMTASESPGERRRVYSEEAAFLVSSILSDRASRSVTFGLENPLATRFWSAVKTGTSKEMRDNWAVGYSRRYTVGVWVGNVTGEPMRNVSGVTGAAPVWLEVMVRLHEGTPSTPPAPPPGLVRRETTFTASVEPARLEWFREGTEPVVSTTERLAAPPRIIAPVGGTIVALDPDLPPDRQRVPFASSDATSDHRWRLDGVVVGDAAELLLWPPAPGRHRLSIVGRDGRVFDTVTFLVRGVTTAGE